MNKVHDTGRFLLFIGGGSLKRGTFFRGEFSWGRGMSDSRGEI